MVPRRQVVRTLRRAGLRQPARRQPDTSAAASGQVSWARSSAGLPSIRPLEKAVRAESRIAKALSCLHPAGGAEAGLTGPLAGLRSLDGELAGVRISARRVQRQGVTADITVTMHDVSGHGFGSGTATATIDYAQLQQRISQQPMARQPSSGAPAQRRPQRIGLSGDGRHLLLAPAQLPVGIKADLKAEARNLTITPVSLSVVGRDLPLTALAGRTPHALPNELLKPRTMALPNLPANVRLTSATPAPDALRLSFALSPRRTVRRLPLLIQPITGPGDSASSPPARSHLLAKETSTMSPIDTTIDLKAARSAGAGLRTGPRPALQARELTTGGTGEPYEHLSPLPCSATIGAENPHIDLSLPLDDLVLTELRRALLEYKVLFFRDQHLTGVQHAAFARHWGEPQIHPFLPKADSPEVVRLAHDGDSPGVENIWHSDASFTRTPPFGSILRAVEVPEIGGDTMWADMAAAYDGLPDDVRTAIDGLTATHDFTQSFGKLMSDDQLAEAREKNPPVAHPVVRTIPETGRRLIYVNRVFTAHIDGISEADSAELLDILIDQARHPEYQVRFHWKPGSIAFWDNRVTQHYALCDYYPRRRIMERVTIIGDRPS